MNESADGAARPLADFAANVTSQFGEDGIIAEIVRRIGVRSKLCVEFGAWDGKHLSNTWRLWHDQGWSAILIEGEPARFTTLKESVAALPAVVPVQAYVTASGENSLDEILSRCRADEAPDLMSIDIDGDEYYVWQGMTRFRPRVMLVEHNPTVPPQLDLVQAPGEYFGASAATLLRLAREKGYRLACCTQTNSIFVAREDFNALGLPEPSLDSAFPRDNLTYVVTAYDGRSFLTRSPTYSGGLPQAGTATLLEDLVGDKPAASYPLAERALIPVKVFVTGERDPKSFARLLFIELPRWLIGRISGRLQQSRLWGAWFRR